RRPEWLETELLRGESEGDDESGRDKRGLRHIHILVDPAVRGARSTRTETAGSSTLDWADVRECHLRSPSNSAGGKVESDVRGSLSPWCCTFRRVPSGPATS